MTPRALAAYWKAIAALIGPAVILFVVSLPDGVTADEWLKILAAAFGTSTLVAAFPSNKPKGR